MVGLTRVRALALIGENDLTYVKKNGEVIELKSVRVTSTNHERNTLNVRLPSGQMRTLKWHLLIKFNNIEITL